MSLEAIDRALAAIEAGLDQPLTVADIAAAAGLSPFHFSRLFTAVRAESVMAYVRRRRLERAAETLAADPGARLVDLAFDCGFESQQAFTRAFTRLFGAPPGRFRLRTRPPKQGETPMPAAPAIDVSAVLTVQDGLEHRPAFRVAGLSGRFDAESRPEIPGLWDRFALPVPGQAGWETYGVIWSISPEDSFIYMAAVALEPGAAEPAGLMALEVPAQTYLVFHHEISPGPLQPQMFAAMQAIWGRLIAETGHKPSGGPDFEFYPADFRPGKGGSLSYYVPVRA